MQLNATTGGPKKLGCYIRRKMDMHKSKWQNIAQSHNVSVSNDLIQSYSQWIQEYVDIYNFNPFLMTFMFKPLKGSHEAIMHQMKDEIDRVYSTFLTRVIRKPNSVYQRYLRSRPMLIAAPDRPVPKHKKQRLSDVTINDGRHIHGILAVPRCCRLKEDVVSHFQQYKRLYVKNRLLGLDVRAIESDLPRVVDYAFKSVTANKFEYDDILILPKSETELRDAAAV
jgi:hypothetical protein